MTGLNAILSGHRGEPHTAAICVIAGTAGAGKTALALHWAHQAQALAPDGQLHVNLRGYGPAAPVTVEDALYRFLSALGVPTAAIPADREAAAALYRSLLAGRRMVVILDNAATAGQVRPLLPGTAGCLVVVTSRSRLSGLAVRDGAQRLTLGTLDETSAIALLRNVTTGHRRQDAPGRLAELAALCAHLPLALRIAAERAVGRPHMELDELLADLRDQSARWEVLAIGDGRGDDEEAEAVYTVFAWSYRALPAEAARLFRLLGLHPGPEFGVLAAAAVAGTSVGRTRRLLDVLAGAHLLTQTAPDRFEFHDLLRAYAADRVEQEEPADQRTIALRRLLAWYLQSAAVARTRISRAEPEIPLAVPDQDAPPVVVLADYDQAMRWYESEHGNLLAAVQSAWTAGLDAIAWQLPAVLRPLHARLNPFDEWFTMGQIGLQAARRAGDRAGEAQLLESLGMANAQSHRLTRAAACHEGALALRRELGDRLGEALSLNDVGLIHYRSRQLAQAEHKFTEALEVFRHLGAAQWEPTALSNLAMVSFESGRLEAAFERVQQALTGHRGRTNERGEGNALRILSAIQREQGDVPGALRSAQAALDIARRFNNLSWEGFWLLELGQAQLADDRLDDALASFARSAGLERQAGDRYRAARAWQGTGETYARLVRFADAETYFRRAAAVHRELDDTWQLAAALDGLAAALHGSARDEEARRHRAEALRLLAPYDDPRAIAVRQRIRRGAY